jgi:hypothetical protein
MRIAALLREMQIKPGLVDELALEFSFAAVVPLWQSVWDATIDPLGLRHVCRNKNCVRRAWTEDCPACLRQALAVIREFPFFYYFKFHYAACRQVAKSRSCNQLIATPLSLRPGDLLVQVSRINVRGSAQDHRGRIGFSTPITVVNELSFYYLTGMIIKAFNP